MPDSTNSGRRPCYVLCPGLVTSENDLQEHYIDAPQLARLYGVSLRDCVILRNRYSPTGVHVLCKGRIFLGPRHDGNYSLPL